MREFTRVTQRVGWKKGASGPDGGVSLPCFLRMGLMRGSTLWSAYLGGGWVDAVSIHGALDGRG
jgi:hypothetical protein